MRTSLLLLAASALVGTVSASTARVPKGYGRFPCTKVNGDGTFSPDQSLCSHAHMKSIAVGTGLGNDKGNQGDGKIPVSPHCSKQFETGAYFCGTAGATCTDSTNCDNSAICYKAKGKKTGTCQGGFTQKCGGKDTNCVGYLYCNAPDFSLTKTNECGGIGSFCRDYTQGSASLAKIDNQRIFSQFCSSGYCNSQTGACDTKAKLGQSCKIDPDYKCGAHLQCDRKSFKCVKRHSNKKSHRSKRSIEIHSASRHSTQTLNRKREICPSSHSACPLPHSPANFECIDLQSNLQQCGSCANEGGQDCTQIKGTSAVACVAGSCEILGCAVGFEWDAKTNTCEEANLFSLIE